MGNDDVSVATGPRKGLKGLQDAITKKYRYYMDRLTPYVKLRWVIFVTLMALFWMRVVYGHGWYIIAYGLGIYLLNLFISFLTPQIDPEDGPLLPTDKREDSEYRPFMRRLSEYKFWKEAAKATLVSICLTSSRIFDVPVFWPILLFYFIMLFVLTMKRQIQHMWKHRYLPFNFGKKVYKAGGKKSDGIPVGNSTGSSSSSSANSSSAQISLGSHNEATVVRASGSNAAAQVMGSAGVPPPPQSKKE